MKHSNDRLIEMLIIVVVSTIVGILGGGAFIYSLDKISRCFSYGNSTVELSN